MNIFINVLVMSLVAQFTLAKVKLSLGDQSDFGKFTSKSSEGLA